jgi:hypothetical protein
LQEPIQERRIVDPESIDPSQFNWFKYLIDTHLKEYEDDGNKSLLHSADIFNSLLNTIISSKKNEVIEGDLVDLVGYGHLDLVSELMKRRDGIKVYVKAANQRQGA